MQLFINKQIGKHKYTFVIEGKNLFDLVTESNKLSFGDVYKCGLCESDKLVLSAHRAGKKDEFKYTEVKCLECKAQLTFGQRKDEPDTFYFRRNDDGSLEWHEYKENGKGKPTDNEDPF